MKWFVIIWYVVSTMEEGLSLSLLIESVMQQEVAAIKTENLYQENLALLHFRTPLFLLMTHHEKTRLKALP